jgi:hypothetical protein
MKRKNKIPHPQQYIIGSIAKECILNARFRCACDSGLYNFSVVRFATQGTTRMTLRIPRF